MTLLCTLIADRTSGGLDLTFARALASEMGTSSDGVRTLSESRAYAFPLRGDVSALKAQLAGIIADKPVDAVVLPVRTEVPPLFLADMDSTMIEQECIDELADRIGIKTEISAITERAMRGEIDFAPALRERVALLKGLPTSVIDEVLRDTITLTPGGKTLLATLKAHGTRCVLVSGGFTPFTGAVANLLGFDANFANRLGTADGHLTGTVIEPILGQDAKRERLELEAASLGTDPTQAMVVGDGANDLAMIRRAGLGVAFRAKPRVSAEADAALNHSDLRGLLYLCGLTDAQIIEA